MPVIAGVGYGSHIAQIMATEAEKLGASALLILPPYYQNACFDGLLAYLKRHWSGHFPSSYFVYEGLV